MKTSNNISTVGLATTLEGVFELEAQEIQNEFPAGILTARVCTSDKNKLLCIGTHNGTQFQKKIHYIFIFGSKWSDRSSNKID